MTWTPLSFHPTHTLNLNRCVGWGAIHNRGPPGACGCVATRSTVEALARSPPPPAPQPGQASLTLLSTDPRSQGTQAHLSQVQRPRPGRARLLSQSGPPPAPPRAPSPASVNCPGNRFPISPARAGRGLRASPWRGPPGKAGPRPGEPPGTARGSGPCPPNLPRPRLPPCSQGGRSSTPRPLPGAPRHLSEAGGPSGTQVL